MIGVRFIKRGGRFCGYRLSGHAGAGEYGHDIVCAAVSSAAYLTANTLTDQFGVLCDISVGDGEMSLAVKEGQDEDRLDSGSLLIEGLYGHMKQLVEQYPENIKIITG